MSPQRNAANYWKRLPVGAKAVAVAATSLIVVAGAANATIPDADGAISGCYVKTTGALRVTDTDASTPPKCRSTEIALAWNQQGIQGETGETGPAGPAGEQGPAGEPGTSGAQDVWFAFRDPTDLTVEDMDLVTKDLPAGSYLIEAQVGVETLGPPSGYRAARCWVTWDGKKLGALMEWIPLPEGASDSENTFAAGQIQLRVAATQPAGTVGVRCTKVAGTNVTSSAGANLVATRVATVN